MSRRENLFMTQSRCYTTANIQTKSKTQQIFAQNFGYRAEC